MHVTVEGTYKDGKVELEETPNGIEQSRVLVTFLPPRTEKKPKSLRGLWAGRVPDDFDVDGALNEIRCEWLDEMKELEP
jgi:hypothetical protein